MFFFPRVCKIWKWNMERKVTICECGNSLVWMRKPLKLWWGLPHKISLKIPMFPYIKARGPELQPRALFHVCQERVLQHVPRYLRQPLHIFQMDTLQRDWDYVKKLSSILVHLSMAFFFVKKQSMQTYGCTFNNTCISQDCGCREHIVAHTNCNCINLRYIFSHSIFWCKQTKDIYCGQEESMIEKFCTSKGLIGSMFYILSIGKNVIKKYACKPFMVKKTKCTIKHISWNERVVLKPNYCPIGFLKYIPKNHPNLRIPTMEIYTPKTY